MKCPFCGAVNQPGESFCSNCGGYLDGSDAHTVVGHNNSPTIVSTVNNTGSANTGPITTGGGSIGSARTLAPNAQLQAGRYVVEKVLGQGGMGAAVLARDTRVSNKRVVIKELVSENTDPQKHQEDVHNFEREVATLADLDHPLIPTVTDSFQEGSHYFMVQEYAAGENLEDRMDRVNQPMAEREALTYASQILDILDYLEQQSPPIVHRDIKPANIIIGARDKRARLVDFGIARSAVAAPGAKRKQTTALGTPGYAPPEQYQGNADARSDIYALAATLHHILTNRDPRNYPPFVYPPVRTLNSKLTPDIERVLDRALKINANERYQNAAAMKHDIDEILEKRFASSGDMSNYTLRTSSTQTNLAPVASPPSGAGVSGHTPYPITPPPPPPPHVGRQQQQMMPPTSSSGSQSGTYAPPKRRLTISPMMRSFTILIVVILLIALVLFLPGLFAPHGAQPINPNGTTGSTSSNTGSSSSTVDTNPISVTQVGNALVGISDGSYTLDTNRTDASLKEQASAAFKSGDKVQANALWSQAVSQDTSDAEALIYQEDLRVLNSGSPYVTLVVATMPSGASSDVGVGRFNLQGAYVLQKEFNDSSKLPNGLKVRLLIASAGNSTQNVTKVANQIVLLSKNDKTFIGVMGWPYSGLTEAAVPIFAQAQIPMVSETASDDNLSNASRYFFHVNPTNKAEAIAGAQYAEKTLGAKKVAVFADYSDPYSQSLGRDFTQQFTGGTVIQESYKEGQASSITTAVQQVLPQNPDLIYFAGYSSDVSSLLNALDQANAPAKLNVLGGDALYILSGYQGVKSLSRLRFTAFAYPDEWDVQGLSSQKPAFFSEYANDFDPNHQHTTGSPYGFTRPDADAMLAYDATNAMLNAVATAAKSNTSVTMSEVESALQHTAFQGVSGWITFDQNGDPVNKALVVLTVDSQGHIQMQQVVNKFLNS